MMKTVIKVGSVILLLLGISLFGPFRGPNPAWPPGSIKGAFAAVATTGRFWEWGVILMLVGVFGLIVQSLLKE